MTTPREAIPPPDQTADRTAALLDLLGRARRALARDDLAELRRLMPLLAELGAAPGLVPEGDPSHLRKALLGLLDEAGQLTEGLRAQQAQLAVQLRAAGVHRRAGVAYRRAGKL